MSVRPWPPYNYVHGIPIPLEDHDAGPNAYPLVLYFASDEDRTVFARDLRESMKPFWLVGHLRKDGKAPPEARKPPPPPPESPAERKRRLDPDRAKPYSDLVP
jgi:hypothetical protein